jgi:hypothetical protein
LIIFIAAESPSQIFVDLKGLSASILAMALFLFSGVIARASKITDAESVKVTRDRMSDGLRIEATVLAACLVMSKMDRAEFSEEPSFTDAELLMEPETSTTRTM